MPTRECYSDLVRISVMDVFRALVDTALDKFNVAMGVVMLSMPAWHEHLRGMSEFAALVSPILGALWIGVQIYVKIDELRARRRAAAEPD